MPIFEYMCVECGSTFEKLVRTSDTQPIVCPKCESERVLKQFSTFAVSGGSQTRSVNAPAACAPGGG
jgi:putative FmdB family regulatory protein